MRNIYQYGIRINYGQFENAEVENAYVFQFDEIISFFNIGEINKHLFRYAFCVIKCRDYKYIARPFLVFLMARLLTFGKCTLQDDTGRTIRITWGYIIACFFQFCKDNMLVCFDLVHHYCNLRKLRKNNSITLQGGAIIYLRENIPIGLISGGSVSHMLGVLNNLPRVTRNRTIGFSFEQIESVSSEVEFHCVKSDIKYANVRSYMSIAANDVFAQEMKKVLINQRCQFIYQRYSINAYAGLMFAKSKGIPFVLEYNSSETWTSKNWGRKYRFTHFSNEVEKALLDNADLITCVSYTLKEQLENQNIDPKKIVVTPNGVDTTIYRPSISGKRVREKYDIKKNTVVIGFIGTFGKWHGVEILVRAFARLCSEKIYSDKIHLFLIGNGVQMPVVKKMIDDLGIVNQCTLTGSIPQSDGPMYLAACDILVSPTLRNSDGTPFFGSPTKLFEYMAMGKGIIASNMEQMSEILENEKTALLVEPNNIEAVADAIERLVEDEQLRCKIGLAAREEVCKRYTWEMHTQKIVNELYNRISN